MKPSLEDLLGALSSFRADPGGSIVVSDVDGTISEIVSDPKAAAVRTDALQALAEMSPRYLAVGLLSGRTLDDLHGMIGLPGLYYVGLHGIELMHGEHHSFDPEALEVLPRMRGLRQAVEDAAILRYPGVVIEDKEFGIAFHYRKLEDANVISEIERFAETLAAGWGFSLLRGRKVRELRPFATGGKDRGIKAILDHLAQSGRGEVNRIAFFGDDVTDIDAFRYLDEIALMGEEGDPARRIETVTVSVAGGPEQAAEVRDSATYLLNSPSEVAQALEFLAGAEPGEDRA